MNVTLNDSRITLVPTHECAAPSTSTDVIMSDNTIDEYKGHPKALPRKNKGRRAKGRSFITTDTPEKNALKILEEETERKKIRRM